MSTSLFRRVLAGLSGRPLFPRRAPQGLAAQMYDLADRIGWHDPALGQELRDIVGALTAEEVAA